jgi:putative nucleotidyltransferase with HDIG domain
MAKLLINFRKLPMYPNRKTCLQMMDHYGMLPNIKDHSVLVADLAIIIGRELNKNGSDLDLELIEAAALLHDITKTESIKTGENHCKSGGKLLRNLGYQKIAKLIEQHVLPDKIEGNVSEEEVVCYADKRILHDKIVSLDDRFEYLHERYGKNEKSVSFVNETRLKLLIIEKRIIENSSFSEFDINKIIV